jgi:large subunit ribosomal protein L11
VEEHRLARKPQHGQISKRRRKCHVSKRIVKVVKMELPGGEAKPGPKLASAGVIMPKFCTDFNARTADRRGEIVPVIITAYEDKSHDFVIKTSPVAGLILKAAGVKKGSANPKVIVGHISKAQLKEIAEYKLPDLNCDDVEAAMKVVAGSAHNMGIAIDE